MSTKAFGGPEFAFFQATLCLNSKARAVHLTSLARPHPCYGFNFRGSAMQPRNPRKFEPLEFYQLYGSTHDTWHVLCACAVGVVTCSRMKMLQVMFLETIYSLP